MTKRLLDRQTSLLEYLTSGAAIFGDIGTRPLDQNLRGIDSCLLNLEARFSHEKRMQKIVGVFPRTLELLGTEQEPTIRAFVAACPPREIGRLANARQFHDFLSAHWRQEPPRPPHLRDVAACELACAEVRANFENHSEAARDRNDALGRRIRRHPGIALLTCAYDIRPIFEAGESGTEPAERKTPVVVAIPPGFAQPQIFEVPPAILDLVAALDDWIDPAELGAAPGLQGLIRELSEHGLLEMRG